MYHIQMCSIINDEYVFIYIYIHIHIIYNITYTYVYIWVYIINIVSVFVCQWVVKPASPVWAICIRHQVEGLTSSKKPILELKDVSFKWHFRVDEWMVGLLGPWILGLGFLGLLGVWDYL